MTDPIERYKKISNVADRLSKYQRQLVSVHALLTTKAFPDASGLVVKYDDGNYNPHAFGDGLKTLLFEDMDLATPILGAVETALREQIRKEEANLRELGCQ